MIVFLLMTYLPLQWCLIRVPYCMNFINIMCFFVCMYSLHQKPRRPSHAEICSKNIETGNSEKTISRKPQKNTWWLCHVLFLNQRFGEIKLPKTKYYKWKPVTIVLIEDCLRLSDNPNMPIQQCCFSFHVLVLHLK